MKNFKIISLTIAFLGIVCACSSKDKAVETGRSDKDGKPMDSVRIRSTPSSNMSNTYPSD